mmetsp:Transcript_175072/g.556009  ORF Transcript_175072/g.556009 Transcript_175072/m.556009 type:complete len:352 (+) Transcript_175072:846-1901(+)
MLGQARSPRRRLVGAGPGRAARRARGAIAALGGTLRPAVRNVAAGIGTAAAAAARRHRRAAGRESEAGPRATDGPSCACGRRPADVVRCAGGGVPVVGDIGDGRCSDVVARLRGLPPLDGRPGPALRASRALADARGCVPALGKARRLCRCLGTKGPGRAGDVGAGATRSSELGLAPGARRGGAAPRGPAAAVQHRARQRGSWCGGAVAGKGREAGHRVAPRSSRRGRGAELFAVAAGLGGDDGASGSRRRRRGGRRRTLRLAPRPGAAGGGLQASTGHAPLRDAPSLGGVATDCSDGRAQACASPMWGPHRAEDGRGAQISGATSFQARGPQWRRHGRDLVRLCGLRVPG